MNYGIASTGFSRKPLAVILAEIEARMVTEFGSGVIQTSQSPLGQINGLMADLVTELWEQAEDVYQSYDPEQAEGTRLDTLGNLRLITRNGASDDQYRRAITNIGQGRVDVQDLAYALRGIDGVTYAQVFVNQTGEVTPDGLEAGTVAVAVIGGDDQEIAEVLRRYVVPGVNTYGNIHVSTNIDGFCRALAIIRPLEVEVTLTVSVRRVTDVQNCPPASLEAIGARLKELWLAERVNGLDVSFYTVRSIIEREFANIEVVGIQASRDGLPADLQAVIGFVEIAWLQPTVILA